MILVDKIVNRHDKGDSVEGMYHDFQQTLDTVYHIIVLQQINKYGE